MSKFCDNITQYLYYLNILINFSGYPERNLPSLDPVHIPRLTFYKNLQDFVATGELINLTASGASSITAKTLKCVIYITQ